ncbi:carbohydrate binding domain-containing protein [Clostridium sp. PL3]|uniref:Carbohydrate binding domain-containing protein n=1 Tax=Clostridium thailandense TaxID=2794346 RepID=A0A949WQZ0_9CLOT|nr:carbohydrate binding domain-containing protein [Clostridium thailandense]MBV7273351.1 carbohydrate binding domain-containing protein [Clostridium thailandense]
MNHDAETSDSYWNKDSWGNEATGTLTFTTEDKYFGSKSLKVTKSDDSAGRYFCNQSVTLERGKTYTLSGYIKTTDITNKTGKGAILFVNYQNNDGSYSTVESASVNGVNNWDRYEVKFTLPSNAASTTVNIRAGIAGEKGTAYFDSLQLEDGAIANRYNLIENSNMTYNPNNDWVPYLWNKNSDSDAYDKPLQIEGRTAFRVNGYSNKLKNINQYIPMSGKSGDVFAASGWAKGDSVPLTDSRYFALDVGLQNTDGTTQWTVIPFNQDSSDWQYVSDRIVANKDYNSITAYALYYNNANTVYFTNIQLYKEEFGVSYKYDSNGKVVSTQDLAKQSSTFGYNGTNDLISAVDPKGSTFKYEYDSKHNINKATSAENVVYSFEYDASGNPTKGKIGDSTLFTQSTSTYTPSGNYIKTLTDSAGNTVTYDYDETKGTLKSVTDPSAKTTSYAYDDMDRLTGVSKNVDGNNISNSYTYENDRIKTITHNGFSYSFNYDSLGNNNEVYVGTQKLITNSYDLPTGNLLQSNYGNGQNVGSDYDNLGRVITSKYNGTSRYNYQYDAAGNLGYEEDLVNGVSYRYVYDLANRLSKINDSLGNSTTYNYDANSNKNKLTEKINGKAYDISYGYDKDNRPYDVQYSNNHIMYTYDSLGRKTKDGYLTPTQSGSNGYYVEYSYTDGTAGATTTKVKSVNFFGKGRTINYTYDSKGNINTITDNNKSIQYYYNELNEVIREDNQILNKTIVYTYDAGGNILTKTEYNYTTVSNPANPINTYSYVYGDSNWKDKLTSYNGKTITYDAIGNPLTYDGWTSNWEEGRQLASMSKTGINISYKYNDDGVRTEKNINGVVTKYHLNGDNVTYEDNGTDKIHYTYDSSGNLISMNLNGTDKQRAQICDLVRALL